MRTRTSPARGASSSTSVTSIGFVVCHGRPDPIALRTAAFVFTDASLSSHTTRVREPRTGPLVLRYQHITRSGCCYFPSRGTALGATASRAAAAIGRSQPVVSAGLDSGESAWSSTLSTDGRSSGAIAVRTDVLPTPLAPVIDSSTPASISVPAGEIPPLPRPLPPVSAA